jgi:hypothetical protein
VNWRSRTSEIKYLIGLNVKRQGNVVAHDPEIWISKHVDYIFLSSSVEIIDAQHIMTLIQQGLTKM